MTEAHPTSVLLSFNETHHDLALELAGELRSARIGVVFDQWSGGGATEEKQAVPARLDGITAVIPLVTDCETGADWIGDLWRAAVYRPALDAGLRVLPIRATNAIVPDYLATRSYVDIYERDPERELGRLIRTVAAMSGDQSIQAPERRDSDGVSGWSLPPPSVQIIVDPSLAYLADSGGSGERFSADTEALMRDGLFYELGVRFPPSTIEVDPAGSPNTVRILLNGVAEREVHLHPHWALVNESVEPLLEGGFTAIATTNPANGIAASWIPKDEVAAAEQSGLTVWDTQGFVILLLSSTLRRRAEVFVSVAEVEAMLDRLREAFPKLVEEALRTVPLFTIAEVLRRLVSEEISIRDLRRILMTLTDWGRVEWDVAYLTEYVRSGLSRYISHKYTRGQGTLVVYLLENAFEEQVRHSITHRATGSHLELDPHTARAFVASVEANLASLGENVQSPAILTSMETRASIRRLLMNAVPDMVVLTYQEMSPDINIQPIGRIHLDATIAKGRVIINERTPINPRSRLGLREKYRTLIKKALQGPRRMLGNPRG